MAILFALDPEPFDPDPAAIGDAYLRYAYGDAAVASSLPDSFADREIWRRIDAELIRLRTDRRWSIKIVDAGCGAGGWLIRTALRARALGFTAIEGRGFDASPAMVALANAAAADLRDPAIGLTFDAADLATALAREVEEPADIILCLDGILNHLPRDAHAAAARALLAAGDAVFVTVRAIGSLPSICGGGTAIARDFRQDNDADRLEVDLIDGRHLGLASHLFAADEFQALFASHGHIVERIGLDLFHGRFATDLRWNPSIPDRGFGEALVRLEHLCASDPSFIDRAAQLFVHARRRD